jgi:serine/threonine protein kinase
MDPERWHQIDELLQAALDRHPNEREVFVHDACSRDAALEDEVRSLLCSERQAGTFLERPVVQVAARAIVQLEPQAADDSSTSLVGQTISGYRVLEKLSEGGMGIVYRAEQNQPRRTIALKVIKPGLSAPDMLRRFELESQALGRLQHPGIAQIYEAGTADTGFGPQPYLAMELILGQPLITYAEMHELNTRQRLEIMAKVCEAVHHAHQRGIIHRDLKPVNILVDESGQPKVLDFGIARLTDSDVYATRRTDLGQVVGTLAYMSPEQVLGDPQELDTRSDV